MVKTFNSLVEYPVSDGIADVFQVPFEFDPELSVIQVFVDDMELTSGWTHDLDNCRIIFNSPPKGSSLLIRRRTNTDSLVVTFNPGSILSDKEQNRNSRQLFFAIQELYDIYEYLRDFILDYFNRIKQMLEDVENLKNLCEQYLEDMKIIWKDLTGQDDLLSAFAKIQWVQDNYAPLDSPALTGFPTAPTAGQGTNTDQLATTAFVQNELTEMIISTKVSFGDSQWILDDDSGKYYLDVVTQAPMFNHIYKTETGGALVFDDSVEVHMKDEGYIHLVASAQFSGYMYTMAPRRLPTFSFSPVDSPVTSLSIDGLVTNPMNVTEFTLPSSAVYNGVTYPVTKVGDDSFTGNSRITKITIGEGIREIGERAFRACTSLSSLILPDSLRKVCNSFIYGASSLTSLTLNDGLETIGQNAFSSSHLTTLRIPASVTLIEPGGVWGTYLTSITVDSENPNYKSVDGCVYSKDGTVFLQYPPDKTGTSCTVESGVKTIDNGAFHEAVLDSVTIPDGCESINASCFFNADIGTLSLPGSISEIAASAFDGGIKTIVLRASSARYAVTDGVLYDNQENAVARCPAEASAIGTGTVTVPAGIVKINSGAFRGCTVNTLNLNEVESIDENGLRDTHIEKLLIGNALNFWYGNYHADIASIEIAPGNTHFMLGTDGILLSADGKILYYHPYDRTETQFTVPDGVETLNFGSFWNTSLTALTLPDSCKTLQTYAIQGMTALTSLNLGSGIQEVQGVALNNCNALTSLTFPASIQTMASQSVVGLANLTDVTFLGTGTWSMQGAFGSCPKLLRIHGYSGSTAEAYAVANNYLFVPLD